MTEHQKVPRRDFLGRVIVSWAAFTSLPFIYGVLKYIFPPPTLEKPVQSLLVAKTQDIPINASKIIKFNRRPIILVHTPQGQFKAFSANCTHLGCVVEYKANEREFHCNCHGSVFDLSGRNIKGPAPAPLPPLKVTLSESDIIISSPHI